MKKFSTNNFVKVKLTIEGLRLLEISYYEMLNRMTPESAKLFGPFQAPEVDENGYSEFQLWELMYAFGPYMCNLSNQPFESDILIDELELEDVESRTH